MAVLKNRAKMSTSATGTGSPITLGSAEDGYQTFADAGVANADVVRYVIEDGNNWEIGTGTYTATGTTLSRTVSESSNSDAAINLSGSATVFIGATAEDIPALYAANPSSATDPVASGTNAVAIGSNAKSTGSNSVALGYSRADGSHSFAVAGVANSTSYGADAAYSIAIGRLSKAEAANAVALGYQARATGDSSVALGRSYAGNQDSFAAAIGDASSSKGARGANSVALGQDARAIGANSITIGTNVSNAVANQISLGGTTDTVRISDSYTLPTADGTNGQVLTTDGSGAVTFADAGGGGADLYAANEVSPTAQPSATGDNAIAIGDSAVASGADALAFGEGATSSSTRSTAIGYNSTAAGITSTALGPSANATGFYSTALGYNAKAASSGFNSVVAMGNSYASGAESFAAAIANNSSSYGATGANAVAMGDRAKAQGSKSFAVGGSAHAVNAESTAIGDTAIAQGSKSIALGVFTTANGNNSVALGYYSKTDIHGKLAYASGRFAAQGDAQGGQYILRADTTDATATVLTTNNSTAGSDDQIVAASDTCITFDGTITAMQNGAQAYASWKIEGLLVNDGGTTTLANSATTVISNGSSWGMALSADNTNNALAITCTGEASHNIRWVANIRTTEVTYA
jgi:autotransporter adhesin